MVCARYFPDTGGTETHVYEVARRLSATHGFDITVLATDRTRRLPSEEVLEGITVTASSQLGRAAATTISRHGLLALLDSATVGISSTAREYIRRCRCWR